MGAIVLSKLSFMLHCSSKKMMVRHTRDYKLMRQKTGRKMVVTRKRYRIHNLWCTRADMDDENTCIPWNNVIKRHKSIPL